MKTVHFLIMFLSVASEDPQNAVIVQQQLERIMKFPEFLKQWYEAFEEISDPTRVYKSLEDEHVLAELGKARDFVVFLTNAVDLIRHDHPDWAQGDGVCQKCIDFYRAEINGSIFKDAPCALRLRKIRWFWGNLKDRFASGRK